MANTRVEGNIPGRGYAAVIVAGGRIQALETLGPEQPGAPILSPGLVDIQLNGFAGVDFSSPDLEPEEVVQVLAPLWQTGVTSFCPTLITNTRERLRRNFAVLESARRSDARFARMVPCYHLEGPYFSPGEASGVHDPSLMRPADWDEFCDFQRAAGGNIGIVTVAPEVPGAIDFIARARAAGVVAALGHTTAGPAEIHRAVEAGATLSTHLGNGCAQMLDRHANPLWAQLASDALYASLICDTFHLPPDLVKVIVRAKGMERIILITDATHVASLAPGRYTLVGTEIELLPEGKVIRADGACLAGSALTMNRAVPLFMELAGAPLEAALAASTANPARLLGRPGPCAALEPGGPANLMLARPGARALEIETVYLQGEKVR